MESIIYNMWYSKNVKTTNYDVKNGRFVTNSNQEKTIFSKTLILATIGNNTFYSRS